MKKNIFSIGFAAILTTIFLLSCGTPVKVTSWKNPQATGKVSNIVVMALFGRLDYSQPTEQAVTKYFNSQGLKSIQSLAFLNPTVKYSEDDLRKKVDSIGADGVLVFTYKGTDKTTDYVPSGYYGYWGGPWGWGWGSPYYSSGYWTTTRTVNVKASLYTSKKSEGAVWTADITVTDPNYIDEAATKMASKIYEDLARNQLIQVTTTANP